MRADERLVTDAFVTWLEGQGWDVRTEVAWVDVVADRDGVRLYAEAKGHTSSPGLDVDTAYGQILRRMTDEPGARFALVVPGTVVRHALRVPSFVRQRLGIEVFSVDEQGGVTSHP